MFVSGLYEKVTAPNGVVKERHYVGGHTIVTYTGRTASTAGTKQTRYLHKDHLGSVVLITDENGAEQESFSFDAWGKRRAPSLAELEAALGSWNSLDSYQKGNLTMSALALGSDTTNKGFTGHEQLDGVGLIHMGGRVYDAEIGRFLSADPFVQDGGNLQALNRYSYVLNNPLSYTDPTGYFANIVGKVFDGFKSLAKGIFKLHKLAFAAFLNVHRKVLRSVGKVKGLSIAISIGLGIACGPVAVACTTGFNAAMTAANGGTIAQILTGAAVGFVSGQLTVGLTETLGRAFGGAIPKAVSNIGAAMFVGGFAAKTQGGKFIDGVKGAAVGAAIGYGISRIMSAVAEPASATRAESGGSPSGASLAGEEGAAQRQATFDEALAVEKANGYVGDHEVKFVNEFAAAKLDADGNILSTETFSTLGEAQQAAMRPGYSLINGETVVGSPKSTVYAGATLPRSGYIDTSSGGARPVNFTATKNARFVIRHEIQHGQGVSSETEANRRALLNFR